jgi:hypothetical protein
LLGRASEVNRLSVSRARSCSQMSFRPVCGSKPPYATMAPSGEIAASGRRSGHPWFRVVSRNDRTRLAARTLPRHPTCKPGHRSVTKRTGLGIREIESRRFPRRSRRGPSLRMRAGPPGRTRTAFADSLRQNRSRRPLSRLPLGRWRQRARQSSHRRLLRHQSANARGHRRTEPEPRTTR